HGSSAIMDARNHIAAARARLSGAQRRSHRCRSIAAAAALILASAISATAGTLGAPVRAACEARVVAGPPRTRLDIMPPGFNPTRWLHRLPARRPDLAVVEDLRARGSTHDPLP